MAADLNTHEGMPRATPYIDRRLIASSVALLGTGFLAFMAGATLGVFALARASSRYVADLPEPPRVMAGRRWQQARSATAAGAGAWREYGKP